MFGKTVGKYQNENVLYPRSHMQPQKFMLIDNNNLRESYNICL